MADKNKPQKGKSPDGEGLQIPIELRTSESIISRYVNHATIQAGQDEFIISLFEVRPPAIFGSEEEIKKQVRELTSIRAECVSRIIVSHGFLPKLIAALKNGAERLAVAKQEIDEPSIENGKKKGA